MCDVTGNITRVWFGENINTNMSSEKDDISQLTCPNTAEDFLKLILTTMLSLNQRVESMETKLDSFLSNNVRPGQDSLTTEAVILSGDLSGLGHEIKSDSLNVLSRQILSENTSRAEVKSGVIIPIGELYLDPNLISNMTNSQVKIESLENLQNTQPSWSSNHLVRFVTSS